MVFAPTSKEISTQGRARALVVYSPRWQTCLGRIPVPHNPRHLAFGDSDFRTLYMIGTTLMRVAPGMSAGSDPEY